MMKVNTNENAQFGLQRTKRYFLEGKSFEGLGLAVVIITEGGTFPFLKLWQITR